MKTELEQADIEAISKAVAEILKPMLGKGKAETDTIFDVAGVATYLAVTTSWVYERTHLKEIPHLKLNGQLRFRKRDIDKWIESNAVPAVSAPSSKLRAVNG